MVCPVQLVTFQPENILCLTKSGNRIKIIDFGLARRFEPMKKLQILFGTPEFVAPEVFIFYHFQFLPSCIFLIFFMFLYLTIASKGGELWAHRLQYRYVGAGGDHICPVSIFKKNRTSHLSIFSSNTYCGYFFYITHAFCEFFQTPHQVIFLRPNPFNWI